MLKRWIGMMFVLLMVFAIQLPQTEAGSGYTQLRSHQGVTWYLDNSSAVALQDDRNGHKFAVNIIVDLGNGTTNTDTYWFYQPTKGSMREAYVSRDGENWREFDLGDTSGASEVTVRGFKAGWYAAFGYGWS